VRAPSEKYTKKKNKHANEKNVQLVNTIHPSFGGVGGGQIKRECQSPTASTLLSPYLKGTSEAEGLEQKSKDNNTKREGTEVRRIKKEKTRKREKRAACPYHSPLLWRGRGRSIILNAKAASRDGACTV
jgi:hypothetical protein